MSDGRIVVHGRVGDIAGYFEYSLEEILSEPFTHLSMELARPFAHLYKSFVS